MKFRPLHDRVVVRRVEEEAKTAGGIIIPDTAQVPRRAKSSRWAPRPRRRRVVALDVTRLATAIFGKWSGTGGQDRRPDSLIMKESDIRCAFEGGEEEGRRRVRLSQPTKAGGGFCWPRRTIRS
ncbi:MAG: co-chaperone GroES [Parvibaculum sp.]|nr:co-chaperone GroES [Parvibaculum sp.]